MHCPLNTAQVTASPTHPKGNTTKPLSKENWGYQASCTEKKCQTASAATAKTEPEAELQAAEYWATISQACTFWIFYIPLCTAWRILREDCQEVRKPQKQLLQVLLSKPKGWKPTAASKRSPDWILAQQLLWNTWTRRLSDYNFSTWEYKLVF